MWFLEVKAEIARGNKNEIDGDGRVRVVCALYDRGYIPFSSFATLSVRLRRSWLSTFDCKLPGQV